MQRRPIRSLVTLFAALGLLVAACDDGEDVTAEPIPGDTFEDEEAAPDEELTPPEEDGLFGDDETFEDEAEEPEPVPEDEEPVPEDEEELEPTAEDDELSAVSGRIEVSGTFGDEEIDMALTEDTSCTIEQLEGELSASVHGGTADAGFLLDLPRMEGDAEATGAVFLDGATFRAGPGVEDTEAPKVRLLREGELSVVGTFVSDDGETRQADLVVDCRPES
jgi:hypothetical protein